MDIDRILNFSTTAGKIMLQSGGEIYRVEETIFKICKSFNMEEVDVFASTTSIVVTVIDQGKIHTIVKRISSRGVNLNKVHKINSLSRKIYNEKLPIEICEKELREIDVDDSYSLFKKLFYAGISTSTFTILFGGGAADFIAAFFIGIIIQFISETLCRTYLNPFFRNGLCGAAVALFSIIFLKAGFIKGIDKLIAGTIMLLVPGLSLTNSLRDILEGQLVAGLTNAAEALFVGVSTAVGTFLVIELLMV